MRVHRDPPVVEQSLVPVNQSTPIPQSPDLTAITGGLPISQALAEDIVVAGMLARSGFFPGVTESAHALAKMMLGRELGIGQATSMRELYVVGGRLAMSATLIGALIRRSGMYDYKVPQLDNTAAVVDIYKQGEFVGRSTFTVQDAEAAGLLTKDNYKKWLRNMLLSRALTNAGRWFCPELFAGGVYTPDELDPNVLPANAEDVIDAQAYSE